MEAVQQAFFDEKKKVLHERLTFLAEQRDLTLYQVEKAAGISRNTLSKCDVKSTQWENLYLAAEFFHVSMDYLTARTDAPFASVSADEISSAAWILINGAERLNLTADMAKLLLNIAELLINNKDTF